MRQSTQCALFGQNNSATHKEEELAEDDFHEDDETARLITEDDDEADLVTRAVFTRPLQPRSPVLGPLTSVSLTSVQTKYSDYSHKGASGASNGCVSVVHIVKVFVILSSCYAVVKPRSRFQFKFQVRLGLAGAAQISKART